MGHVSIQDIKLEGDFQGTDFNLRVFRFGERRAGAPKIYMHAALHADEPPGMLILHHLLPRLPYHSLPEAHRRLSAALPETSAYPQANYGSLGSLLKRLGMASLRRH